MCVCVCVKEWDLYRLLFIYEKIVNFYGDSSRWPLWPEHTIHKEHNKCYVFHPAVLTITKKDLLMSNN